MGTNTMKEKMIQLQNVSRFINGSDSDILSSFFNAIPGKILKISFVPADVGDTIHKRGI